MHIYNVKKDFPYSMIYSRFYLFPRYFRCKILRVEDKKIIVVCCVKNIFIMCYGFTSFFFRNYAASFVLPATGMSEKKNASPIDLCDKVFRLHPKNECNFFRYVDVT